LVSDVTGITATNKFTEDIIFEGATADAYETTLTVTDPTADRTVTIPNVTGTLLTTSSANPASSDGAALGSASLEWSDLYLADGGVIYFGDDQDVTLTHVADTGIRLADSDKMQFGTSGDLEIYHDGSNSYIVDGGTGNLKLYSNQLDIIGTAETLATFVDDGAVTLYYDNTAAIATASGGGTLTGTWEVTTALVPDASDGAALGTTALEWSDLYLADGAVVGFGDDQDVTLTHVADTGILLNSTMAIQFNDASQYINAPSNAILDINATDEIELNATLVDINANVEISGDLTVTGDDITMGTNTSGAALIADGTNFNPVVISGDATIATNGALTIASTSVEGSMLNNNVISGQTALTSGVASTDELMISDAGTLKRVDVSLITALATGDATALAIALG
jgi:hypothetical protein